MAKDQGTKNWEKCTVTQLKKELKARGLLDTGIKAELVERLKINDKVEEEIEGIDAEMEEEDFNEDEEEILVDEDVEDLCADDHEEGTPADQTDTPVEEIKQSEENGVEERAECNQSKIETDDQEKTQETDKVNEDECVLIETVGEVDDEEFVAVVAGLDNMKEEEEEGNADKKERDSKRKEKKIELKDLKPLPAKPMYNWMLKQFSCTRDFSSLYIKPLSSKDVLCEAMHEWANRAIYFNINHERNGKGVAVLNFQTEGECKEAKEALAAQLDDEVKILHPSRHIENEMTKDLSYKVHHPHTAQRLLIVEDVPENASEDQIGVLFPGSITVSHPPVTQQRYTWHEEDYCLPENVHRYFFVEFATTKETTEAVGKDKEYEIDGQKLKVQSFEAFDKGYHDMELKRREELRKKRIAEVERQRQEKLEKIKAKVLEDSIRIEKCQMIEELEVKRRQVLKQEELTHEERMKERKAITVQIEKIISDIEQDTNYRKQVNMTAPEPENQMSRHTRVTLNIRDKTQHKERSKEKDSDRKDSKDRHHDRKRDNDRGRQRNKSSRSPSRESPKKWAIIENKKELTQKDHNGIREEIEKMEEDTRGWWHFLIHKPKADFPTTENEMRRVCSKYGKVMQVHFTDTRIFVRFNSYKAVAAAVRDLWGTDLKVEVPHVHERYKKKNPDKDRSSRRESRGESRREVPIFEEFRGINPIEEQMIKQQQQMILQKQLEEQQLQQAKMLQTAVQMMQTQPQMQTMNQVGLLGNVPQSQSMLGQQSNVLGMMNTGTTTTNNVPSLLAPTGVPPLMRNTNSDIRESRDDRSHRNRNRSRTPEKRRSYEPSRQSGSTVVLDAKRLRMDDINDQYSDVANVTRTITQQVDQISRLGGDSYDNFQQSFRTPTSSITPSINRGVPPLLGSSPSQSFATSVNSQVQSGIIGGSINSKPLVQGSPLIATRLSGGHGLLPTVSETALIQSSPLQGRLGMQTAVAGLGSTTGQGVMYPGVTTLHQGTLATGIQTGMIQGQLGGGYVQQQAYQEQVAAAAKAKQPLLQKPYVGHQDRLNAFREGRI